ncbi:hypothetical protein MSAN_00504800 [Mycena sanguinolenta]|uniref:Uncharacterized protein n=1 Tax=Mycena sanguinolenta TaxID=230812 RepID=A0A8H6Z5J6_9AGAR|nr:hypothetical protein MSAN_00504800 [Mycena sanguinolenta]
MNVVLTWCPRDPLSLAPRRSFILAFFLPSPSQNSPPGLPMLDGLGSALVPRHDSAMLITHPASLRVCHFSSPFHRWCLSISLEESFPADAHSHQICGHWTVVIIVRSRLRAGCAFVEDEIEDKAESRLLLAPPHFRSAALLGMCIRYTIYIMPQAADPVALIRLLYTASLHKYVPPHRSDGRTNTVHDPVLYCLQPTFCLFWAEESSVFCEQQCGTSSESQVLHK